MASNAVFYVFVHLLFFSTCPIHFSGNTGCTNHLNYICNFMEITCLRFPPTSYGRFFDTQKIFLQIFSNRSKTNKYMLPMKKKKLQAKKKNGKKVWKKFQRKKYYLHFWQSYSYINPHMPTAALMQQCCCSKWSCSSQDCGYKWVKYKHNATAGPGQLV